MRRRAASDPPGFWRDRWWQRKRHHCIRPRDGSTGETWRCPHCGRDWTFGPFVVEAPVGPSDRHDDGIEHYVGWH